MNRLRTPNTYVNRRVVHKGIPTSLSQKSAMRERVLSTPSTFD